MPITKLREFLGVMAADKISEASSPRRPDFWPEARTFAEANGIKPLTAADFLRLFRELPTDVQRRIISEVTSGDFMTPSCPSCDSKMVWKPTPAFWACPKHPRCRSKPIHARGEAV
jgi:restriction system protein